MLYIPNCNGRLEWRDRQLEIAFGLSCSKDGQIALDLGPVTLSNETFWLTDVYTGSSQSVELFSLKGADSNGNEIRTESAYLTAYSQQLHPSGAEIILKATALQLEVLWSITSTGLKSEADQRVEYLIVGQRGFGTIHAQTSLGEVQISALLDIKDYSEISGLVSIKRVAADSSELSPWLDQCDELVQSILDVLSLADGHYISWSIRQLFYDSRLTSTTLLGPKASSHPIEPLFSHLNLQPILDLALQSYTQELRNRTGINIAIQWFLIHPSYSEAQFLAGMTALEHLIHVYVSRSPHSRILPSSIFKKSVRPVLEQALQSIFQRLSEESNIVNDDLKDALESMESNLGGLNRKSLRSNLDQMLDDYKVPLDEIKDFIYPLISIRNEIVHRGYFDPTNNNNQSISFYVTVLRELLKRIFLALLKYEGEYLSFLNGPKWVSFPPTKQARP